jgi:hypothetical protein
VWKPRCRSAKSFISVELDRSNKDLGHARPLNSGFSIAIDDNSPRDSAKIASARSVAAVDSLRSPNGSRIRAGMRVRCASFLSSWMQRKNSAAFAEAAIDREESRQEGIACR